MYLTILITCIKKMYNPENSYVEVNDKKYDFFTEIDKLKEEQNAKDNHIKAYTLAVCEKDLETCYEKIYSFDLQSRDIKLDFYFHSKNEKAAKDATNIVYAIIHNLKIKNVYIKVLNTHLIIEECYLRSIFYEMKERDVHQLDIPVSVIKCSDPEAFRQHAYEQGYYFTFANLYDGQDRSRLCIEKVPMNKQVDDHDKPYVRAQLYTRKPATCSIMCDHSAYFFEGDHPRFRMLSSVPNKVVQQLNISCSHDDIHIVLEKFPPLPVQAKKINIKYYGGEWNTIGHYDHMLDGLLNLIEMCVKRNKVPCLILELEPNGHEMDSQYLLQEKHLNRLFNILNGDIYIYSIWFKRFLLLDDHVQLFEELFHVSSLVEFPVRVITHKYDYLKTLGETIPMNERKKKDIIKPIDIPSHPVDPPEKWSTLLSYNQLH